jgi:hypothetical protein
MVMAIISKKIGSNLFFNSHGIRLFTMNINAGVHYQGRRQILSSGWQIPGRLANPLQFTASENTKPAQDSESAFQIFEF